MMAAENIDEEMAADWAAIREKHAEPEVETPEPVVEAAPETPEPEPTERPRDATGKFVKQTPEASPAPAAAPDAGGESAVTANSSPPSAPDRDINRPPSTWKPQARAEWEKLTPAVRAEIHRRESDFLNGHSQLRPDADFGKSVREVVAPYRMLIEAEGGTPERAIGSLLRTAALFRVGTPQQKLEALAGIARQYNVDLRPLTGQSQPAQPTSAPLQDPRVDQLLAQMNAEKQARAQAEQDQLEGSVTTWMNEQDEKGQPKRPY